MTPTTLYRNRWVSLLERDNWTYVSRPEEVVVIVPIYCPAFVKEPSLILVEQHRKPLDAPCIELPAGLVDPGETPAVAARRELQEETGHQTSHVMPCGRYPTSPGLTDEQATFFFAYDTTHVGDPEPGISVHIISFSYLPDWLEEQVRLKKHVSCNVWTGLGLSSFGKLRR